jgi:hypothetical protein
MQSIGVHFELVAKDDEDFGAARADTSYAAYERELRENTYRSKEFMRRAEPGSVLNRGQPAGSIGASQRIRDLIYSGFGIERRHSIQSLRWTSVRASPKDSPWQMTPDPAPVPCKLFSNALTIQKTSRAITSFPSS